jgi:4a-hydroxytetrahydrobiopterin dehydratase
MDQPLNQEELHDAVEILPGWELVDGRLVATFQFKNFVQAFSFMTAIALEAEKMNHHPNWSNSYNKVRISLFTHDSKTITDKDILLARKIQQLAQQIPN